LPIACAQLLLSTVHKLRELRKQWSGILSSTTENKYKTTSALSIIGATMGTSWTRPPILEDVRNRGIWCRQTFSIPGDLFALE